MKRVLIAAIGICSLYSLASAQKTNPSGTTSAPPSAYEFDYGLHKLAPDGGSGVPTPLMPPGNDACASATTLTMGAGCITGTTNGGSTQGGEYLCISPGGGISPETSWYRFTATNDSAVLGVVITNTTNCATVLAVYGPFAPGGGCLPGMGSQLLCQNMGLIDPGFHPLLTGLTIGQDYLVQVQGNNCGGGNDRFANFCISIASPAANIRPSTANVISNCGFAFNGTTAGGYFNNGTSIGSNNLDNNNATSIVGASEVGDDVNFVVNNCSWFSFCNGNAGACNWSLNLSGVAGCLLPAPNAGVQAAVFGGTPGALTTIATSGSGAASIIPAGGSWASGTFSLASGACAYIVVDGFAGDQCNYTLTLTNVSCPCVVLPVELAWLTARDLKRFVQLDWVMASEDGITHFIIETSDDGLNYSQLGTLPSGSKEYVYQDHGNFQGWKYYRVLAVDQDGVQQVVASTSVNRSALPTPLVVSQQEQQLNVQFHSTGGDATLLSIIDVNGRVLLEQQILTEAGVHSLAMDVSKLEAGVYFVRASNGNAVQTAKFLKR
jgi:hypothetical protein